MTAYKEGTRPLEAQADSTSELDQVATLQSLDRQLQEKVRLVAVMEGEIAEISNEAAARRAEVETARSERLSHERNRRELDARLEDEEGKNKDRRMRLNRVRNERELMALRREIDLSKEANQQTESDLLAVMQVIETIDAQLGEREAALRELEAKLATVRDGHREQIETLTIEVTSDREARDRVANELPASLRGKYEQIRARRGGTTVVEVRNGTCTGCHMHVPPQLFNELQKTRAVRLCPNCHRILYWRPEPGDAS